MAKTPPIAAKVSGFSAQYDVYETPGADFPVQVIFREEGDVPPENARLLLSGLYAKDIRSNAIHTPEIERIAANRRHPMENTGHAAYVLLAEAYERADKRRDYVSSMDVTKTVSRLDTLEHIDAIQRDVVHPGARKLMDVMLGYPSLHIRAVPDVIAHTSKEGHERKFLGLARAGVQSYNMHLVELYTDCLAKKDSLATWLLMEELAHKAIEIVYGNKARPFEPEDRLSKRAFFYDLRDDLDDWWETSMPKARQEKFPTISAEFRSDLGLGDPSNPAQGYRFKEYGSEIPAKIIAMKAAGVWNEEMQWKYPRISERVDTLIEHVTKEMGNYARISDSLKGLTATLSLDSLHLKQQLPRDIKL